MRAASYTLTASWDALPPKPLSGELRVPAAEYKLKTEA
jgi:hypothetical protein